jgi:hypothetical protein
MGKSPDLPDGGEKGECKVMGVCMRVDEKFLLCRYRVHREEIRYISGITQVYVSYNSGICQVYLPRLTDASRAGV